MTPKPIAQALILLLMPLNALAYIDPGSGMLLWQSLIAAIGVGLVCVRHPWTTIKNFLRRIVKR